MYTFPNGRERRLQWFHLKENHDYRFPRLRLKKSCQNLIVVEVQNQCDGEVDTTNVEAWTKVLEKTRILGF